MARPRRSRTGRSAAAIGVLTAIVLPAALIIAGEGPGTPTDAQAQQAGGSVSALPLTGTADSEVVPFGAVTEGPETGATWAYRRLSGDASAPELGGQRLPFGPQVGGSVAPQLAFLKTTSSGGWAVTSFLRDKDGNPYRGPAPNFRSARMTASGGAVLVGQDGTLAPDKQLVVMTRKPEGAFAAIDGPPSTVLLGANDPNPSDPAEALAGDRGSGRVNVAIADSAGGPTTFFVPVGRAREAAVIVHDGSTGPGAWTREPLDLDNGTTEFRVAAIAASSPTDAYLVGSSPGKPIRIFKRTLSPQPGWQEVSLAGTALADAAAATTAGLNDLALVGDLSQTLTVSGSRVWVDARYRVTDGTRDATFFIDPQAAPSERVTSWCAATSCDQPFDAAFAPTYGYRSYAWSGSGFGTRVITNPLRPDGSGTSNRGTYLQLVGDAFVRRPGGGGNFRGGGAFAEPTKGWLQGPVEVGTAQQPATLRDWPVALRAPLTSVAPEPGKPVGDLASSALAVGGSGAVARYLPDQGWVREFLLSSNGAVVGATLRSVAWPEAARAHAVGDNGAMWLWRSDTGLWERDPAAPVGFEGHLTGVAFDPSDPQRGYAVGKQGVLLQYDKTWQQMPLPAGFEQANFTAIAFAGRQAIAVSDVGVLINDGAEWKIDEGVRTALKSLVGASPLLVSVAGLPDGGAVLAGYQLVIKRDSQAAEWRFSAQPLLEQTAIAVGAFRQEGVLRAVVSTTLGGRYPSPDPPIEVDPNTPTPLLPAFPLPADGYLLRETSEGWQDQQRTAFLGSGEDRPVKSDPILALALDGGGSGWAVGGWSGEADAAGRGASGRSGSARNTRSRVETGAVMRYAPAGAPAAPAGESSAPIDLPVGPVRFAVGGHAQCSGGCADLANQGLAPDRMLTKGLDLAAGLADRPGGPRAFLYTGGRTAPKTAFAGDLGEQIRYAELLAPRPKLPVFAAVSEGDLAGTSSEPFTTAFTGAPSPFGTGATPDGVTGIGGGTTAQARARTHYAFDSAGAEGKVRVIVIDNAAGSLAASDPHQNPAEPQEPWLIAQLADAKQLQIPSIVVGSRDLNSSANPPLNVASDADRVAKILVDGGASAYFFDRPEENRTAAIPAGAPTTITQYGTGTLGYRSYLENSASVGLPDALFGGGGILLAEIQASARDPLTNRAPVNVRLLPVIERLSLQALDGTLLRRSRPALFQGLGRRPTSGDRWGSSGSEGSPNPSGADPYTSFPLEPCLVAGCGTRITPEYRFSSSAPDVLDFVQADPASANLRKPFLGPDDKVVTAATSALVCPFNAGTSTITVAAGGLAFSQTVRVLPGSVLRPCGTRPLDPSRIRQVAPRQGAAAVPPPPASAPPAVLPALVPPPPPPLPEPAKKPEPKPTPPVPPLFGNLIASAAPPSVSAPSSPPPPPPGFFAQPIPPGGATVRVHEEKREEEIAPEQSQANAVAYNAGDHLSIGRYLLGLLLIASLAGVTIPPRRRRAPAYASTTTRRHNHHQSTRRYR